MAQASSPPVDVLSTARLVRRSALKAARGAALVVHAASGLAMRSDRDAERLLRSAEGLIRAAAALLELPQDPTIQRGDRAPVGAPVVGFGADVSAKRNKGMGNGKDKGYGIPAGKALLVAGDGMDLSEVKKKKGRGGRRKKVKVQLCRGDPVADCEIDDAFADMLSLPARPHGPLPLTQYVDGDGALSRSAADTAATRSAPYEKSKSVAPATRALKVRHSSSRSPRRPGDTIDGHDSAHGSKATLAIGDIVLVGKLVARPELTGTHALIVSLAEDAERAGCKLTSGETLGLRVSGLVKLEGSFLASARKKFEALK